MTMTISRTLWLLGTWADDADGKALSAPDAFSVVQAHQRAERYRAMVTAIREAIAAGQAPVVVPSQRRRKALASEAGMVGQAWTGLASPRQAALGAAPKKGRSVMDAPSFWSQHGMAVQAIIAVYGTAWKICAPLGETELAEVPSKWCSWKGPCGTRITWPSDARVPAARFWPDGVLPDGVTTFADFERASVEAVKSSGDVTRYAQANREFERARDKFYSAIRSLRVQRRYNSNSGYCRTQAVDRAQEALAARKRLRALPKPAVALTHDAAWHETHGYVWNGKDWVSEIGHRASLAHNDAIAANREEALRVAALAALERACLEYGPQPFPDIADDVEALSEVAEG